ncbi:MAG TPA: hypothetical protein VIT88_05860 [Pyrinomonadaceae bacterium]
MPRRLNISPWFVVVRYASGGPPQTTQVDDVRGNEIVMKKHSSLILVAMVVIFVWFNVATYWWVSSFDSVAEAITQTWNAITSNWMILILLSDSAVFLVMIFVWLLRDARQRGWTSYKGWAWIIAMLVLGSPALLVYLIIRPELTHRISERNPQQAST